MEENSKIQTEVDKIYKIAISLFAFLQQSGIKTSIVQTPGDVLSYTFSCNDMTNTGEGFGLNFIISNADIIGLNDEVSIEQYCFKQVLNIGLQLLTEKATRLLQYGNGDLQKSRIIVPGK